VRPRAALGLALLALAVVAALVASGRIGLPRAGSVTSVPKPPVQPRPATTEVQRGATRTPEAHPPSDRTVAPRHAAALFAQHSWYVAPPPSPPVPPPPAPTPTAPPFPYTFVGSFAPEGERPVFFLLRGDRVIDAHVGDRLDGVYQFESAGGGQLVFVYLPLNIRQNLPVSPSR
jgi:hypothetical protein